jgi:hypothetical protein
VGGTELPLRVCFEVRPVLSADPPVVMLHAGSGDAMASLILRSAVPVTVTQVNADRALVNVDGRARAGEPLHLHATDGIAQAADLDMLRIDYSIDGTSRHETLLVPVVLTALPG